MKKYKYYIGIDTGVNTGYSLWNSHSKKFVLVQALKIHWAIDRVNKFYEFEKDVLIRVEDARKRTWFGKSGREQLQGAGSIKRDCSIWEDFLTDLGVDFEMVAPKNNRTKLSAETFRKMTGWSGQTNEHSRDAGMLVFGL